MSERWDVLGFGAVAVDDLITVEHYPPPDSKAPVLEERREGGGLTGTALVAAARLGTRAAYCGVLGDDDELSLFSIHALEHEGVDCSATLRRHGARPIHSTIIVDRSTGQRSILFSLAGVTPRQPGEMTEELIGSCRVLFVDHTVVEGSLRAIDLAHERGIPVVGDVERETSPGVPELIARIDHLIVGIDLAQRVTGAQEPEAMVRSLGGPERACCVVTAGSRGCWYAERGGEVHHFPAYPVQVVDTTGCGDVFHGAYAAYLARGAEIRVAIQAASAAAALKATRPGGRAGIPNRAQVERFIEGR